MRSRSRLGICRCVLIVAPLTVVPLLAQQGEQQPSGDRRFTHQLLAPGIAASAPFAVPLRTVPARMVMRHFVVGRGIAKDVPNPAFAVMEVHAGNVFTTISGERKERVPGDIWTVDQGATITFENPHVTAAAIIGVIYFEPAP